jgi:hypothetical protein
MMRERLGGLASAVQHDGAPQCSIEQASRGACVVPTPQRLSTLRDHTAHGHDHVGARTPSAASTAGSPGDAAGAAGVSTREAAGAAAGSTADGGASAGSAACRSAAPSRSTTAASSVGRQEGCADSTPAAAAAGAGAATSGAGSAHVTSLLTASALASYTSTAAPGSAATVVPSATRAARESSLSTISPRSPTLAAPLAGRGTPRRGLALLEPGQADCGCSGRSSGPLGGAGADLRGSPSPMPTPAPTSRPTPTPRPLSPTTPRSSPPVPTLLLSPELMAPWPAPRPGAGANCCHRSAPLVAVRPWASCCSGVSALVYANPPKRAPRTRSDGVRTGMGAAAYWPTDRANRCRNADRDPMFRAASTSA